MSAAGWTAGSVPRGSDSLNQAATSSAGAELRAEPAPSPSWGNGVGGDLPAWRKKISARRDERETGPVLDSPSKF